MASSKEARKGVSMKSMVTQHQDSGRNRCFRIPAGMKLFFGDSKSKKEGVIKLDFLPYRVKSKSNPHTSAGSIYCERTYYQHRSVGVNEESVCCLAKTFNKPCPVCEYKADLQKNNGDPELIKNLKPKERNLWIVVDASERQGKTFDIQLFDYSDWLFGRHLREKMDKQDPGDDYDLFADLSEGKTLKIGVSKDSSGGFDSYTMANIEFKAREPYSEKVLDMVPDLDDLLIELPYAKLKAMLFQTPEEEDDEPTTSRKPAESEDEDDAPPKKKPVDDDDEPAPKNPKKPVPVEDDDEPVKQKGNPAERARMEIGMMVRHEKHGKCEIIKISTDGENLTIEDSDGAMHRAIEPSEVTLVKSKPAEPKDADEGKVRKGRKDIEDDDEPAPPKKGKKAAEEPFEDDEDAPPKKKKKPVDDDD